MIIAAPTIAEVMTLPPPAAMVTISSVERPPDSFSSSSSETHQARAS